LISQTPKSLSNLQILRCAICAKNAQKGLSWHASAHEHVVEPIPGLSLLDVVFAAEETGGTRTHHEWRRRFRRC